MKKLFLSAFFMLLAAALCAQEKIYPPKAKPDIAKYELGVNFCSVIEMKLFGNHYITRKSFMNGLMFKKHYGHYAARIGLDLMHYTLGVEEMKHPPNPFYNKTGSTLTGELRVGLERELRIGKFRPFIAADLLFGYSNSEYNIESGGFHFTNYNYLDKTAYVGIAPAIGLKYQVCERISLTFETSLSLMTFQESSTISNPVTSAQLESIHKWSDGYLNPLRLLTLNYHFN